MTGPKIVGLGKDRILREDRLHELYLAIDHILHDEEAIDGLQVTDVVGVIEQVKFDYMLENTMDIEEIE